MDKLWFRAKTYGWGWVPASRQGWFVMLAFIAAVAVAALGFLRPGFGAGAVVGYLVTVALLAALLILICWKTGERPRWNWGKGNIKG